MSSQDLTTIVHLEHINFCVPDQGVITDFFLEAMGFTRDPYQRISGSGTMWINVGRHQVHLNTDLDEPQVFDGRVGFCIPSVVKAKEILEKARDNRILKLLKPSKFAFEEVPADVPECMSSTTMMTVTGPYGNTFNLFEDSTMNGSLGIKFVEFNTAIGTAAKIAKFYEHFFQAMTTMTTNSNGECVLSIKTGPNQVLRYREVANPKPYSGHHIAMYVTDFGGTYLKLQERGLTWSNPRFADNCDTLESAEGYSQYRFKNIIDVDSDASNPTVVHVLEHEVRSLYHKSFLRALVNRYSTNFEAANATL
eukprot:GFYU01013714.1.p1 GENE.GFYU01013714.1~~GFYU01013714.1.p1  ORF type:complete len:308 (+),score=67.41 GFYU01013714.1:104-1027(+)